MNFFFSSFEYLISKFDTNVTTARDKHGLSSLHLASQTGQLAFVQTLLTKYQMNPDDKSDQDMTPLFIAAENGNLEVAQLLLEFNASLTQKSNELWTPLHISAFRGQFKMVKFLIESGSDVNSRTSSGSTPLILASENGHLRIVEHLLQNGANLKLCQNNGKSALYLASANGHYETVTVLEPKSDLTKLCPNQTSAKNPMYIAAINNHESILLYFMTKQNSKTNLRVFQMSLYEVSSSGSDLTLAIILNVSGIDVNMMYQGETPIHPAARNGHLAIIKMLIRSGADINVQSGRDGETALYFASKFGFTDMVVYCSKHYIFLCTVELTQL